AMRSGRPAGARASRAPAPAAAPDCVSGVTLFRRDPVILLEHAPQELAILHRGRDGRDVVGVLLPLDWFTVHVEGHPAVLPDPPVELHARDLELRLVLWHVLVEPINEPLYLLAIQLARIFVEPPGFRR